MLSLSIDPGADQGWAMFDGTCLIRCGLGIEPRDYAIDRVIVECPVVYPHDRTDPNDLIKLARKVGRIEERYAAVEIIFPRNWKGTTPKKIMCNRIRDALSPKDRALFNALRLCESKAHNVLDAIGLGKWAFAEGPWRTK